MTGVYAFLFSTIHATQARFADRKDRGATAVEYGLLVGLIAVVIIVAITLLGDQLLALFNTTAEKVKSTVPTSGAAPTT
ncbi:Flp family type IVb pilin [Cumulibacter manganitolerans]|uniref:Flp family type IVb pilin n=1 Tax=Cumulibacter manganitolerans TaxID=1884992 RepID=UPI001294E193|nr:Flp family type IVb pilin [Cumulibacter manganitolerans]